MMTELEPRLVHAPELYGSAWLNGGPVSVRDLEGAVLLLDFWDYSCISCRRTLPYVKSGAESYRASGLVAVGVHTPEFAFAADEDRVSSALRTLGVEYPVVLDNAAVIWGAYANRYWPTRYLIDRHRFIRFVQHGEGGYQAFERAIQVLLRDAGVHGELPSLMEPLRDEDVPGALCHRPTGEIHVGYLRGALGNVEGYVPEARWNYEDPGFYLPGRFYAVGIWWNGRECFRSGNQPGTPVALVLPYEAKEVHAVMGSADGRVLMVTVEQDGAPLPEAHAGADVRRSASGATVVEVQEPRLYRLVRNPVFGTHHVRLTIQDAGCEVYAFSFVTSVIVQSFSEN